MRRYPLGVSLVFVNGANVLETMLEVSVLVIEAYCTFFPEPYRPGATFFQGWVGTRFRPQAIKDG